MTKYAIMVNCCHGSYFKDKFIVILAAEALDNQIIIPISDEIALLLWANFNLFSDMAQKEIQPLLVH